MPPFVTVEGGCDEPLMGLGAISSAASEDEVAAVAQPVECVLGKDEVTGSIPVSSFLGMKYGEMEAASGSRSDQPASFAILGLTIYNMGLFWPRWVRGLFGE